MDENLPTPPIPSGAPREQYIRTFARDQETLKAGGTPDLAPLAKGDVLSPELPRITPLQTYESDFSDRMKSSNASMATVLAAEQDASPAPVVVSGSLQPGGFPYKNVLFISAGVLLLVLGATGAYLGYSRFSSSAAPVVVAPAPIAPIFVDESVEISGTGVALMRAVQDSAAQAPASGVRLLSVSGGIAIFPKLFPAAPAVIARNVRSEGSMAGVVNAGGTGSAFFILSVASYGETFSGMLAWETVMPRDFAPLYPPFISVPVIASSTATTTTPSVPAGSPSFADVVVGNHDARAYRDASGRTVFLYGYWNQSTLIIARDEKAFAEIAGRLATSRSRQ